MLDNRRQTLAAFAALALILLGFAGAIAYMATGPAAPPQVQMSALKNPRHERFAQALAKGMSADAAYKAVGYKPHRGNAATL
jgi:hypothetical protein